MQKSNLSEKLLIASLIVCVSQAYLEIFGIIPRNLLNPTNVLEFTFFMICVRNFAPETSKFRFLPLFLAISVLSIILIARSQEVPYFESIRAYKWSFFLIFLLGLTNDNILQDKTLIRIYKFLLVAISLSYFTQIIVNGWSSRPILIIENNYECALLIGLFVTNLSNTNIALSKKYLPWNLLLIAAIVMSQSRSALITLILVGAFTQVRTNLARQKLLSLFAIVSGSFILILYTFGNRGTSLQNLDRFKFLSLFLKDFADKTSLGKLLGNWIIKPLNTEICIQLRFYSSLQDNESLGSCYSVVYHSFVIRALNDFGLLGAMLIFYAFAKILLSRLDRETAICLMIIAVSNSLSVSGINNIYVVLPMLIALLSRRSMKFEETSKISFSRNIPS